jgi:predicted phosphodiesterase
MRSFPGRRTSSPRTTFLLIILGLAAACVPGSPGIGPSSSPAVRFGIVTDSHYADVDPRGTRPYRESIAKMDECVAFMARERVDFLIELGDFKDQDDPPAEAKTLEYLRRIERSFAAFPGPRFHVLGNHDHDSLSKAQFLSIAPNTGVPPDRSFYAFDRTGIRFIVLDACFNADGAPYDHHNFGWDDCNVPPSELAWLRESLSSGPDKAVVFIHQQLDGSGPYYAKNAADVRAVLEASNKVLAVFQGHRHEGAFQRIAGIPYYTLVGMIEGRAPDANSYAVVAIGRRGEVSVRGQRKAVSMDLGKIR